MSEPELTDVLAGLSGQLGQLSTDILLMGGTLATKADVNELKTGQTELRRDFAELKGDMREVKTDVAELKTDMVIVKADVAGLKTDVASLSTAQLDQAEALALLAADVTAFRNSHALFEQETNRRFEQLTALVTESHTQVRVMFEDIRDQVRLVAEGHSVLAGGLVQLRNDMNDHHVELQDQMAFMHKDLCARIDRQSLRE